MISFVRMRSTGALKLRRGLLWKTCEISRSTVPRVKASLFVKREMFRFVFIDLTWSCSSLKYSCRMTGTSLTIRLHPFCGRITARDVDWSREMRLMLLSPTPRSSVLNRLIRPLPTASCEVKQLAESSNIVAVTSASNKEEKPAGSRRK